MEAREVKACEMTGDQRIAFRDGTMWHVHSQTTSRYYRVNPSPTAASCECDDFALHGSGTGEPCKHIMAVRMLLERQLKGEPNPAPEAVPPRPPRRPTGKIGSTTTPHRRPKRTISRCFSPTCVAASSSRRRTRTAAAADADGGRRVSPRSSRSIPSFRPAASCPTCGRRTRPYQPGAVLQQRPGRAGV